MLVRKGECCRCGDCCKGDPFDLSRNTEGRVVWCPHTKFNPDATVTCTGRDTTYYLSGCASFPSKPEHLIGLSRCTFYFEEDGE